MLCPNGTAVLSTQEFASYQWFRIPWGGGTAEPIPGATGPELEVSEQDMLYSIFVEVRQDTCIDQSDTVLVDGLFFIPPYVIHEGDYTYNPQEGVFEVCRGDTMFLNFSYEVNITWYRNGQPIEGEHEQVLAVTEAGVYTVEGAPAICPDYIVPLGLLLEVALKECQSALKPAGQAASWRFAALNSAGVIQVARDIPAGPGYWRLFDVSGRQVWTGAGHGMEQETLDVGPLHPGMYVLLWLGQDGNACSAKMIGNQ